MNLFSIEYWVLIGVLFILYWLVPARISRYVLLMAGAVIWYSFGIEVFVLAIMCAVLTYILGRLIETVDSRAATIIMWLGIAILIGAIAVSRMELFPSIGVSFYSFRLMSYLADVKNGAKSEKSIVNFGVYASFFPIFIAGPVVRYNTIERQIKRAEFNYDKACKALFRIVFGVFQKAYVADKIAGVVDGVYSGYASYNGITIAVAAVLYSMQIYCDFAGYSNIVIGVASLFGFELEENFLQPYFATSIADFWRRWHVSLSTWLKDYVYIPLGGKKRKSINILITFLVSGLWHGFGMGFVVWGLLHGIYQIVGNFLAPTKVRFFDKTKKIWGNDFGKKCISIMVTFFLVTFAWFFFRVPDIGLACRMIKHSLMNINQGIFGISIPMFWSIIQGIMVVTLVDVFSYKKIDVYGLFTRQGIAIKCVISFIMVSFVAVLFLIKLGGNGSSFIYAVF